ncbi:Voltage-gated potassium channel subunit beta-2 [Phytophthora boehmeriae]|uniref:Voltage-gated potassium channel subunit beta-2 n=1 Tax=Phytophthora boehmeriae TaxID=109152 RepID=A0A8T1VSS0_9STRA|nr:Voltage-gated potassium channel subunit beta-2 [Phytophthora boehmeriae]
MLVAAVNDTRRRRNLERNHCWKVGLQQTCDSFAGDELLPCADVGRVGTSPRRTYRLLVGASRPSQLEENLKALEFVDKIIPEVKAKIDAVVNFVPKVSEMDQLALLRGRHL